MCDFISPFYFNVIISFEGGRFTTAAVQTDPDQKEKLESLLSARHRTFCWPRRSGFTRPSTRHPPLTPDIQSKLHIFAAYQLRGAPGTPIRIVPGFFCSRRGSRSKNPLATQSGRTGFLRPSSPELTPAPLNIVHALDKSCSPCFFFLLFLLILPKSP